MDSEELMLTDHMKIHRSDAQLKKMQRAEDGRKAMLEYEAERAAVQAKTERLRKLRLAREAELEKAAKAAPRKATVAPKKKVALAAKTKAASAKKDAA
jgi:hypothetical protein